MDSNISFETDSKCNRKFISRNSVIPLCLHKFSFRFILFSIAPNWPITTLHQDNAPAHSSVVVIVKLMKLGFTFFDISPILHIWFPYIKKRFDSTACVSCRLCEQLCDATAMILIALCIRTITYSRGRIPLIQPILRNPKDTITTVFCQGRCRRFYACHFIRRNPNVRNSKQDAGGFPRAIQFQ